MRDFTLEAVGGNAAVYPHYLHILRSWVISFGASQIAHWLRIPAMSLLNGALKRMVLGYKDFAPAVLARFRQWTGLNA
jgi:hypothetical protein